MSAKYKLDANRKLIYSANKGGEKLMNRRKVFIISRILGKKSKWSGIESSVNPDESDFIS